MGSHIRRINPIRTGGGGNPTPYGFFSFTQKIFLQPIPEISWLLNFWLQIPPWFSFSQKNLLKPFWDTPYKNIFFIFGFNQKNLFTKPSWNNLKISQKNIFRLLEPPGTNQIEENWKFHIWSVGYQNRVKRSSFRKEFLKNIQKWRFWFLTFLKKVNFWGLFQV